MKIILASQSERRKQLLRKIFPDFEVVVPDVEEVVDEARDFAEVAILNARIKAKNVAEKIKEKDCWIISADTIVVLDNKILGKPETAEIAFEFLKRLSGTLHKVITGCCIFNPAENKMLTDFDVSYVKFRNLTNQQIENFLSKNTFYDKAGGYAVQEIGDEFVEEIKGSYDNIVGLPVELLKKMVADFSNLQTVEIIDIGFPNSFGVGKYNGKTVFIEDSLPGDIVWFHVKKNKGNFLIAQNCGIKKFSEKRVQPLCKHFGICGGCAFQNLEYNFQTELKKKYLIETISRIGKIENSFDIETIIHSPEIYFYRNKMEFAFGISNEKIILGLRERKSPLKKYTGYVNKIENCPIFADFLSEIFPLFIQFAEKNKLEPYNPFTKKGSIRHLVLRHGKNTGEIMIILVTKPEISFDLQEIVDSILDVCPEIVSFWWVENDQISDVVSFQKKHHIYGKPFIEEKIDNFRFRIYPETFFQPNSFTAQKLYEKIQNLALEVEHEKVLGLYCGSGPIEIFLSQIAKEVTGVDNNPANIQIAEENCQINNIKNCNFLCVAAEKFFKKDTFKNQYDLIVVDPPRGGLTPKAIKKIINQNAKNIIYVSCNPATLARDISIFKDSGYQLKKIVPVDMFPHTAHLESCCLIKKV